MYPKIQCPCEQRNDKVRIAYPTQDDVIPTRRWRISEGKPESCDIIACDCLKRFGVDGTAADARRFVQIANSKVELTEDPLIVEIKVAIMNIAKYGGTSLKVDEWDHLFPDKKQAARLVELGYHVRYYGGGSFDTPEDYTITWPE